ncbi:ankyrin repeat domain-containing protein [Mycobacterium sp. TY814]|uniref:ankyrin repeat domain-containing protein n=1 Tax=Mycobacterium sp. TY814 TaxID=3050580 RepID=UPI00274080CF|nr:ankyrin repeat domain-containing protein [Mycobacterium sp. TY814]MDP7724194.1 ankyrin repeat domain-containing protein [Mycobacterium sp. TY814]
MKNQGDAGSAVALTVLLGGARRPGARIVIASQILNPCGTGGNVMTERENAPTDEPFVWRGILDPDLLFDDAVSAGHELANAAKVADWSTVFELLDDDEQKVDVNWWRPGGTRWFTVLHQAAWHGAPNEVAAELIRRGALKSLTDARGRTACDIRRERDLKANDPKDIAAQKRKSLVLRTRYLKPPTSLLALHQIRALNWHLAEVIDSRICGVLFDRRDPQRVLRYPPVEIMHEVPGQRIWFPVPGMYGGFDITLMQDHLDVKSWCRVVDGSGQAHVVTTQGAILVDEGFV